MWLKRALRNFFTHAGELKTWVEIIGLVAVFIAAYNFWKDEIHEPSTRTPLLVVSSAMERSGTKAATPTHGQLQAVTARITAKNPSKGRVKVLANALHVHGVQVSSVDRMDGKSYDDRLRLTLEEASGQDSMLPLVASRHMQPLSVMPVYATIPFMEGTYFEPGEEASASLVFQIPDGVYDFLRLEFQITEGRDDEEIKKYKARYDVSNGLILWDMQVMTQSGYAKFDPKDDVSRSHGLASVHAYCELALWPNPDPSHQPTSR